MKLPLIFTYAPSADQGAGTPPVEPPVNDPPAQPPTAGQAGTPAPETRFTQADLDRIAGETRKAAKSAERAALLKELGVEDLDAVKAAMQAAQEAAKAKLTEAERAAAERAELEKKLQAAETAKTDAEQARLQALLEAEVVSRASGRFANPKAAVKLADLSKVEFKDGQFTGVEEALAALAEAEPWTLAGKGTPTAPHIGATNGAGRPGGESEKDLHARFFGGGGAQIFNKRAGGVVTHGK